MGSIGGSSNNDILSLYIVLHTNSIRGSSSMYTRETNTMERRRKASTIIHRFTTRKKKKTITRITFSITIRSSSVISSNSDILLQIRNRACLRPEILYELHYNYCHISVVSESTYLALNPYILVNIFVILK